MVRHGHFQVNGRKVDLPYFLVKEGDVIEVREGRRQYPRILEAAAAIGNKVVPSWIQVEMDHYRSKIAGLPTREEIPLPVNEQLIVELYSK